MISTLALLSNLKDSSPSLPFVDAQANIIKDHVKNLDLIIIYAGHNEWVTEDYFFNKSESNLIYFDN